MSSKYEIVDRICKICGQEYKTQFWRNLYFCSRSCYHVSKVGAGNPKWRGGEVINKGYRYMYNPSHPNATKQGYVLEHRLVMESATGRLLSRKEVVHHKNEKTLENNQENLLVCESNGHHISAHHHPDGGKFNRMKTHCLRGHEFTLDNTVIHVCLGVRKRMCKACESDRKKRVYWNRRQASAQAV